MKEQIAETCNRPGYKMTKLGWIPKEWEVAKTGDLFEFKNGLNKGKEYFGKGTPIVNYMDVFKQRGIKKNAVKGLVEVDPIEIQRYSANKGDLFFTRTSETIDQIGFTSCLIEEIPKAVFSGFVLRARPISNKTNLDFRKYCYTSFNARKEIITKSSYTTRALTNGSLLSEVLIPLPPLSEQKKIADILSTWDKAIETTQALIDQLQLRKKGLMQQLLTGKKRLPGFSGEWEEVRLGEITNRLTKKNVELNDSVVTISAQRGFVRQEDFFKKRVASKTLSGYYLIDRGHFAYNKSYSNGYPMGAFKRLDDFDKAVVTTLYICFEVTQEAHSDFILYYFEGGMMIRNLMRIAQEGGRAHGLLNISLGDFFGLQMILPNKNEQSAIAQVLTNSDKEIDGVKEYLAQLQEQKKGLMQQLLTGAKRVKV